MASLIAISDDLQAFLDLLDETGGELTKESNQVLEAWFAEVNDAFADKADGYCGVIRELELRIAARREEAERLTRRYRTDENTVRHLKSRLRDYMEHFGIKKQETRRYTVSVQANGGPPGVDVSIPAKELPPQFQRVTVAADTEAIRSALAKGERIDGVVLQERGSHLRIR